MNFTLFNKPEHSIPNISLGFVETICKSIKPHYSNIILDDNFFNVYDAGKRKLESIYFYQYIKAKLSFIPVQMLDKHIFEEMEATSLETLLKLTPKFPLSKINIYKNDDDFSVLNIGAVSNVYLFINLFDNEMGKVVGTMCILINHY
jgi:hypothetical protein